MTVAPLTEKSCDPTKPGPWPEDPFEKALAAEPNLRTVDRMVRAFVALAPSRRSSVPMCAACVWELVLKPLTYPWVGWGRGRPAAQAPAEQPPLLRTFTVTELRRALTPSRPPAESDTEAWLRTSEAYDVVTDRWLKMLDAADPAHGHGIGRSK